jgi:hypothetical protein
MIFQSTLFSNAIGLGSYYQGGFIVYLNIPAQQGLIVSPVDMSGSAVKMAWEVEPYQAVTTTNTYGSGQTNTNNILALTNSTPAAELCDSYSNDGYSDWFLPNTNELLKVFSTYNLGLLSQANIIGYRTPPYQTTKPLPYWSSYSTTFNQAELVDFAVPSDYSGQVGTGFRATGPSFPGPGCYVRACRYMTFT